MSLIFGWGRCNFRNCQPQKKFQPLASAPLWDILRCGVVANVNKFHETLISPSNFKPLDSPSDCLDDGLCYFGWLFLLSNGVNCFWKKTTKILWSIYSYVDRLVPKIFTNVMLATFYYSLPKAPRKIASYRNRQREGISHMDLPRMIFECLLTL